MDFECITLFPNLVLSGFSEGVVGRALDQGLFQLRFWNPRDFTEDTYRRVDDRPYGGGPGMVMMAPPLERCLLAIRAQRMAEGRTPLPLVLPSPQGVPFVQDTAQHAARTPGFIFLCGRYEAVDQRFIDAEVDIEWSLGDFVLSGGELPALAFMDAMVRLLPGVLRDPQSALHDSFSDGLLDCPHYTRPELWRGTPVPEVLRSGNHADIARWRRVRSLSQTQLRRRDLITRLSAAGSLTDKDLSVLRSLENSRKSS